jgi:hypothetical protein
METGTPSDEEKKFCLFLVFYDPGRCVLWGFSVLSVVGFSLASFGDTPTKVRRASSDCSVMFFNV